MGHRLIEGTLILLCYTPIPPPPPPPPPPSSSLLYP